MKLEEFTKIFNNYLEKSNLILTFYDKFKNILYF